MNEQPVLYYQTDARWKNTDYSAPGEKTTIGGSGCGPTCMAMVIATWANKNVTPVETCTWALKHGYKAPNQGTYYSYFAPQGAEYGIQVEQLNWANLRNLSSGAAAPYHAKAVQAIQDGDMVICCMGPGLWTSGGHFILLWGIQGDTAYINDPASSRVERTRGSLARLQSEVKYYFICHRPAGMEGDEIMTQEQFNKMMTNYLATPTAQEQFKKLWLEMRKELQDNDSSEYSDAAKKWITEEIKLFEGGGKCPDGKPNYMWEDLMTREQFATVLYRFHIWLMEQFGMK